MSSRGKGGVYLGVSGTWSKTSGCRGSGLSMSPRVPLVKLRGGRGVMLGIETELHLFLEIEIEETSEEDKICSPLQVYLCF